MEWSSGTNKTSSPLRIAEQLTEAQDALSKLTSQVQKIQESLQAIWKIKPQTESNRNDTSISEMSSLKLKQLANLYVVKHTRSIQSTNSMQVTLQRLL